jgi:hypothetical protein
MYDTCFKIGRIACGHMSLLIIFSFQNKNLIGLISIIKVFAIKMMIGGTPWKIH